MKVLQIERIPIHHSFMNQSLSQVCKCDQFEAYTLPPIPYLRKGKCVTPFPKADPGLARPPPPPPSKKNNALVCFHRKSILFISKKNF